MSEVKKFKSALPGSDVTLEVEKAVSDKGVYLEIKERSILIAPFDAPALCLAILEAAGVKATRRPPNFIAGSDYQLENAAYEIDEYIRAREITAEAEAQAKLEAEALELANTYLFSMGVDLRDSFDAMTPYNQEHWLAVARAARELNKEDGR